MSTAVFAASVVVAVADDVRMSSVDIVSLAGGVQRTPPWHTALWAAWLTVTVALDIFDWLAAGASPPKTVSEALGVLPFTLVLIASISKT